MFINPLMLIGLGAAFVPVLLHFLSRARYRNVQWGGMMFLQENQSRRQQSSRMSQLLLLLLRGAIVGLLAVALARPVLRGAQASASGRSAEVTAVLVLDCSGSMAFDENGRTRLDLARVAARQVLDALHKGDRAGLVLMGAAPDEASLVPTPDLREADARIRAAKATYRSADAAEALDRAADLLESAGAAAGEIYVISDRQACTWASIDGAFARRWHSRAPQPRLFAVPVGGPETDNVLVRAVELRDPPAVRGQPAEVQVQIQNIGPVQRAALPLTVRVGTATVLDTTVNIGANASATVRAPVRFPEAGSQLLSAAIKSAGLTADDRLDAVVQVIEPVRVLVVSGDERPGAFRSESDFLRLALAPHGAASPKGALPATAGPATADPAIADVVSADDWLGTTANLPKMPDGQAGARVQLGHYPVLVLANVERFSAAQARALEQFVYEGGGVLIAPGNLSRVEDYNATLYRAGAGILPAELAPATAGDGSQATTLLGIDLTHPVFHFLRGRPDPIPAATIGRYFPAAPRAPDAKVLAGYGSGRPFLIEGRSGGGVVLLMTTPLDADWSTLPLSNFYLPYVQSLVRYLAVGSMRDATLSPGQPIQAVLEALPDDASVVLFRPDSAEPLPLPVLRSGDQAQVRFAQTAEPGLYRVVVKEKGKDKPLHFVVRAPQDESDLTQLTDARWTDLEKTIGVRRIETGDVAVASAVAGLREGQELWAALIGLVLLLAVLELAAARAWSAETPKAQAGVEL